MVSESQSDVKLQVELNGVNLQQCEAVYQNSKVQLSAGQLCAGGKQGEDSCSGDSGKSKSDSHKKLFKKIRNKI